MLVEEGGMAAGELPEQRRRHGIGIRRNGILNVVHLPFGSGVLVDLQFLVKEGIGLFYDGAVHPKPD
jgi:hypothetical protein